MLQPLLRKLFRRRPRRYLRAVYVHPQWEQQPVATVREKIWRWFFHPEHCDADGRTARKVRFLRLWLLCAFLGGVVWFFVESFMHWNVFSGD